MPTNTTILNKELIELKLKKTLNMQVLKIKLKKVDILISWYQSENVWDSIKMIIFLLSRMASAVLLDLCLDSIVHVVLQPSPEPICSGPAML